ncbi:hypothetical protein HGRIS_003527 [Hohenbuehelia grisea]|uniref:Thioesterase domain-containing protein n=1 Tax=Hohenbuehelia grisea TaxID=104357 RepID=A0ABR3JFW6_9AGAR
MPSSSRSITHVPHAISLAELSQTRHFDLDAYMRSHTILPEKLSAVSGNAPANAKEVALKWLSVYRAKGTGFSGHIADSIRVTEASIISNPEEPSKDEGRVVCEIEVTEDMVNDNGQLHEGCAIYFIDECSTLALSVLLESKGLNSDGGVSQTIDTTFHSSAPVGAKLRIVNISMGIEEPMFCTRSEVWDDKGHKLIATAVQTKMRASRAKTATAKL